MSRRLDPRHTFAVTVRGGMIPSSGQWEICAGIAESIAMGAELVSDDRNKSDRARNRLSLAARRRYKAMIVKRAASGISDLENIAVDMRFNLIIDLNKDDAIAFPKSLRRGDGSPLFDVFGVRLDHNFAASVNLIGKYDGLPAYD